MKSKENEITVPTLLVAFAFHSPGSRSNLTSNSQTGMYDFALRTSIDYRWFYPLDTTMAFKAILFSLYVILSIYTVSSRNPLQEAYANIRCGRVGYSLNVEVHNCEKKTVAVNICRGTCLSASIPNGAKGEQVPMCTCCTETQTESISVGLWCRSGPNSADFKTYYHQVKSAVECSCTTC